MSLCTRTPKTMFERNIVDTRACCAKPLLQLDLDELSVNYGKDSIVIELYALDRARTKLHRYPTCYNNFRERELVVERTALDLEQDAIDQKRLEVNTIVEAFETDVKAIRKKRKEYFKSQREKLARYKLLFEIRGEWYHDHVNEGPDIFE
jgi:hypothetical protein